MTQEEIIHRIREEIDKIYEKYEGHPLIEEDDIMEGFEIIISDYCEEKSLYVRFLCLYYLVMSKKSSTFVPEINQKDEETGTIFSISVVTRGLYFARCATGGNGGVVAVQ